MSTKEMTTKEKSDNLTTRETTRARERFVTPEVDIFETAEGLTLVADLPGISKENLDIHVEKGILTIQGSQERDDTGGYIFREFAPVGYYRRFELPSEIDQSKIEANLKGGALTLKLPKAVSALPKRIDIKAA